MKVLLTGGCGYIGSVLVKTLLDWGKDSPSVDELGIPCWSHGPVVSKITVIDSLVRKQNTLGQFCTDPRFNFVFGDVCEMDMMIEHMEDADFIIPLAGVVGAPQCEAFKARAWDVNMRSLILMAQEMKPDHKIIYPCTNSGYGSRPDGQPITEEDPLNPISTYGNTKVEGEVLIRQVDGVSLRLATVMGWSPCMRLDLLVNQFVWQAVKRGVIVLYEKTFRRNYIHVEDVCQAFKLAIEKYDEMKGQAYNVGLSTANLTKFELSQKIAEYVDYQIVEAPLMQDPDKRDYLISNNKIEALGFKPEWTIDATIQQLVKFYSTVGLQSANIFFENWK